MAHGGLTNRQSDSQGNSQFNHPAGFVRVTDEPRQLFYDPFDAALDTTNLWNTPTVGNSAVLASVTTGQMSMGTGTTASGWSKLTSQPTFKPTVPSWLGFSSAISLPDGAAPTANSYRFWGSGSIPAVPTTAAPLTDAVGFEMTTAGHLCCVVYAGGTRTLIADLNGGKQPVDANQHRYIVYIRTDRSYWYIDGLDGNSLVATSSFQAPQIQTLTATMLAIGGSTPPAANTQIQCNGTAVWDEGKNTTQLSDGTYPWRKQTVNATGQASVVDTPVTSGGLLTVTGSVGATPTAIKASAGQLYGYHLFNTTAAVAYVQIFNVASGSVTLGTTAPTMSIGLPASGGATINYDKGIAFSTAMSFACTTTRAGLTGATCDVNFLYK